MSRQCYSAAVCSRAWMYDLSLVEVAGSNPASVMDFSLFLLSVVEQRSL